MRKFLLLFLIPLLLCTACERQTTSATDLLSSLLSLPTITAPDADIYFAQGEASARLDAIMEPLYGVPASALNGLSDYAVYLGRGTDLFEIHILRAVSHSDVPAIRRMLEARARMLRLATEEGHPTKHNAIVCENGRLLFLFATPCNEALADMALA